MFIGLQRSFLWDFLAQSSDHFIGPIQHLRRDRDADWRKLACFDLLEDGPRPIHIEMPLRTAEEAARMVELDCKPWRIEEWHRVLKRRLQGSRAPT